VYAKVVKKLVTMVRQHVVFTQMSLLKSAHFSFGRGYHKVAFLFMAKDNGNNYKITNV
jgi:hypothetical protein